MVFMRFIDRIRADEYDFIDRLHEEEHSHHTLYTKLVDIVNAPRLGIFFLLSLVLVIGNVFSLQSIVSRFTILMVELAVVPILFILMRSGRWMWRMSYIVVIIGVIASVVAFLFGGEISLGIFAVLQLLIILLLILGLINVLFRKHEINFHTIMGAASLYVLVGLLFARLFYVMDILQLFPGPFFAPAGRPIVASDFVYYSFVTMTTIGYGDLIAASQFGRLFSVVLAVLGQLYLVVVIAMIVGNFSSHLDSHVQAHQDKVERRRQSIADSERG
jgi:hypothetical protein